MDGDGYRLTVSVLNPSHEENGMSADYFGPTSVIYFSVKRILKIHYLR